MVHLMIFLIFLRHFEARCKKFLLIFRIAIWATVGLFALRLLLTIGYCTAYNIKNDNFHLMIQNNTDYLEFVLLILVGLIFYKFLDQLAIYRAFGIFCTFMLLKSTYIYLETLPSIFSSSLS